MSTVLSDRLRELGLGPAEQGRLALPNYSQFPTAQEVRRHAYDHPVKTVGRRHRFNSADSMGVGAWLLIYKTGTRKEVLLGDASRWPDDDGILQWDQAADEWVGFTEQGSVDRAFPLLPQRV